MSIAAFEERAQILDRSDPLRAFRDRFHIPVLDDGSEVIYLAGNSLGLQPKSVPDFVVRELDKWKTLGVSGHFEGDDPWMPYHELVRGQMADLVGGLPHEVVVMNSLTVNLHLMMATFFEPRGRRRKIMIESESFPSDRYAVQSQLRYHGLAPAECLVELSPRPGSDRLETNDVVETIERHAGELALILLGGVNYYSGEVLDMKAIAATARGAAVPIGFDLAHAVGNVPLNLHDWGADFAAWCSYKYLNAGPGGIAGCFIHERHARDRSLRRLAGWWGHNPWNRFDMPHEFDPMDSADGWQLSNPPILLLAALRASLDIFKEAGMAPLREKSLRLTGFLREMLSAIDGPFRIITPSGPEASGSQLSLHFQHDARSILGALEDRGVRCDYREPDVVRIAPVPLYNTFSDTAAFAGVLNRLFQ
ncbi:MAG TPA: kynureninase [Rhodothermales bacterium]|nr:kynureninase [Rhodothermales bacterium]